MLIILSSVFHSCHQIYKLSNEYFHLIPEEGYSYEKVAPIDDMNRLSEKWKNINTLLELECASRIIAAAQYRCKGTASVSIVRLGVVFSTTSSS